MALLTPTGIDDLVNLTLEKHFKKKVWVDISNPYTDYIVPRFLNKKLTVSGGTDIRFTLQYQNTGNAQLTGLFAQDVTGVKDLSVQGVVPWSHITGNWSYDVGEPDFQGGDDTTIVSAIAMREHSCENDEVNLMEGHLWTNPSGTSDTAPRGIPHWLVKDASTTPEGAFNGGNPTNFSGGAAGIDSSTYSAWKNWAFGYTQATTNDLVRKIKKSLYKTKFMAPSPYAQHDFGKMDCQIFTTYAVREPLERLAESRNDNLGSDVAKYINQVVVAGCPLSAVPYLDDNDSSNPVYGVNFQHFRMYVCKGWDRRRTRKDAPLQRNVKQTHYDTKMGYVCNNRRAQWVGSVA